MCFQMEVSLCLKWNFFRSQSKWRRKTDEVVKLVDYLVRSCSTEHTYKTAAMKKYVRTWQNIFSNMRKKHFAIVACRVKEN